jgi:hypothetical protein
MIQRVVGSVLAVLLLCAAHATAQQGTTEVRGRVMDPQGGMLPGVTITVRNQDTGMFRETVSGGDGTFIVSGIVQSARPPASNCRWKWDPSRRS